MILPPGEAKDIDDAVRAMGPEAVRKYIDIKQAEARPTSPLQPVNLEQLIDCELATPKCLVEHILPLREVTLFGSHGGAGKTLLALVIAAHVAAGEDWGGLRVKRARVLFVSLEDDRNVIAFRLQRILRVYNLNRSRVLERLAVIDASEVDAALAVEVSDQGVRRMVMTNAFRELAKAAEGVTLVIIDNASDAFDADENSRRQTRFFIRELRTQIARENDAAVLLLAHIDKLAARHGSHGNSYSGSTAWHNSVRSRLALLTDQEGQLQLVHEKANLGPRMEPALDLRWDGPVLVPHYTDPATDHELRKQAAEHDSAAVREYVARMGDMGRTVPANLNGAGNVYVTLADFCPDLKNRFPDTREGKTAFRAALAKCLVDKTLVEESYKTDNRNSRKRLVLSQPEEKSA